MSDDLATRYAAVQAIAREGGQLARRRFAARDELKTSRKGVQDLVSEADRQVEALIIERLRQLFPEDGVLGEESGAQGSRERLWVVDPIDGTNNFLRGIPYWSVSVAYVRDGNAEIGVIYDPMAEELFAACRGAGVARNGEVVSASGSDDLSKSVLGFAYSRAHPPERYGQAVRQLLSASGEYRRMGSAALMMAHVADGRLDGFYSSRLNSWDVLAGVVLAREAGAWVSDFLVGDSLWDGNAVLACAPGLRSGLLEILRATGLPTGDGR